jgi:hypothetical protein
MSSSKPKRTRKPSRAVLSDGEIQNVKKIYMQWTCRRPASSTAVRITRKGPPTSRELVVRKAPDDKLFAKLAGLARIPDGNFERFRSAVVYELDEEWFYFRLANDPIDPIEGKAALAQLRRLRRASENLRDALASLNDTAIMMVRFGMWMRTRDAELLTRDEFLIFATLFSKFADYANEALFQGEDRPERESREVGRPAGGALTKSARGNLVPYAMKLLWDVRQAGGRLTFDKNTREGTLLDALRSLQDYLPPRFMENLTIPTLSRLKTLAEKFVPKIQK